MVNMVTRLLTWLAWWWIDRVDRLETASRRRAAMPDGTRVRLTCRCTGYDPHAHGGIWTTEYQEDGDDYRLTREGDGEATYAARNALEVVLDPLIPPDPVLLTG
jgi:hypothetical protein